MEEHSNRQRTPYLFTGKELDEDVQLYYFGARYYDPRTSVWQSPDPILASYLQGKGSGSGVYAPRNLNLFAYSHQRPIVLIDPDGEEAYAMVRDLNDASIQWLPGAHSFIMLVTNDPSQYPASMQRDFRAMSNQTGETIAGIAPGAEFHVMTLGGHNDQENDKLVSTTNESADMRGVSQLFSGKVGSNDFDLDTKVEGGRLTGKDGVGIVELDVSLFSFSESYDDSAVGYDARILHNLRGKSSEHNCHGWGAGLANVAGVTNYPTEFFGYDPGINHPVPNKYYSPIPD
ncbi:RHS repeat-associated core domain-containing protein [Aliiroseovarius crassostreae]|uniref:RHS repeat-associated core domain-containing protein n=1 Tax=Aliiroseovarius crassostreae TaxID=154981 RepID=UPI00220F4B41|nr:RHS repeat-associated core domain-containing protein [Aliiroseovarius crassostreae]UWQ06674.1 RHS repeat-associated core domain-containing protein [Aliiroseovarius crassostreae]